MWPWVVRTVWFVLPFTLGPLLGDGLTDASAAVQTTGLVLAWSLWGVGLVATLIFHPAGLVALRAATPLTVAAAVWSRVHGSSTATIVALGLGSAVLALVVMHSAETGHLAVNGPAYPNEHRFLLRPSAVLLVGPIPLAGAVLAVGPFVGPLLLATRQWIVGGFALILGVGFAFVTARSLYALARRFVVFVPAGFVVHDQSTLREPVLFRRQDIESFRAAPAGSDSLDLTSGAPGLALEVLLREKVEVTKVRGPRDIGETGKTARFLIVPTRPGRLLATAAERRYPTG